MSESSKEYQRRYREENRVEISRKAKEKRAREREKSREQSRRSYVKNRTKILATRKQRRAANRSAINAYAREYRAKNAEAVAAYEHKWRTNNKLKIWAKSLSVYGITPEGYIAILLSQGNVCAICNTASNLPNWYGVPKLAVDHAHDTGRVRGLLCTLCNQGLGSFKDDPRRLQAAIEYLSKSSVFDDVDS